VNQEPQVPVDPSVTRDDKERPDHLDQEVQQVSPVARAHKVPPEIPDDQDKLELKVPLDLLESRESLEIKEPEDHQDDLDQKDSQGSLDQLECPESQADPVNQGNQEQTEKTAILDQLD